MRRALFLIPLFVFGCERRPPPPALPRPPATTRPTPAPTTTSAPDAPAVVRPAEKPPEKPRTPKRPTGTWATLVDVFNEDADAELSARTLSPRRLEVRTNNIRLLQVDLSKLPAGAATSPPWNVQIDGQPFELSGRRGKRLQFVRSPAGVWEVAETKP